jgi:hypothetical protein
LVCGRGLGDYSVRLERCSFRSCSSWRRDLVCDGFQGEAELVDLDLESGEGKRIAAMFAVFFDDGAQFRSTVEDRDRQ